MPLPRRAKPMNAKPGKPEQVEDIEDIAERAERGEDISAHFTKTFVAKQRVNIDFPLALLREIDAECGRIGVTRQARSEEHTSELQSQSNLVCRLLLEKKKKKNNQ